MFITCPNCKKKFKIDLSLIPIDGRDLKCGSCEHIWFYKKEDKKTDILSSQEDSIDNPVKPVIDEEKIVQIIEDKKYSTRSISDKKNYKNNENKIPLKNKTKNNAIELSMLCKEPFEINKNIIINDTINAE